HFIIHYLEILELISVSLGVSFLRDNLTHRLHIARLDTMNFSAYFRFEGTYPQPFSYLFRLWEYVRETEKYHSLYMSNIISNSEIIILGFRKPDLVFETKA
ncbi:MAG: hypothetical protein OSJ61_17760, partial [Lachnospiraceae bacterium]|nr:hypothetical protein [Lachnospiraceae bacterium]